MVGSLSKEVVSKDRFFKSKLVALFKTLSKAEVKAFAKYLAGTSYKADNAIFHLFDFLKKYHPDLCESKVNTHNAWHAIFDANQINQKKLLQLRTNLVKVLEDFLIKLQLEKSQPERDFLLLNALKERKLNNQFSQKVKEVRKKWEKDKPPGIEQLHNEYKLENLYNSYKETTNIDLVMEVMQKDINNLDFYYFAKRLHLSYGLALSKNYFTNDEDQNEKKILNNLLTLSNQEKYVKIPAIHLSNLIFKDLLSSKFDNYNRIRDLFYQTFEQYSKLEQKDILNFLIHCCIQNEMKGDKRALKKLFDLIKWAVENRLYVINGYVNYHQFTTIVNIACRAKQYKWARNFISKYQLLLVDRVRDDIVASCIATCLYSEKKFEELLSHLVSVNFKNILISVNARCLQIMAYVELKNNDDLLFNSAKALNAVISRNDLLSIERKEGIRLFIKYSKILTKLSYKSKIDYEKLKNKVINSKNLIGKKWILEKLEYNQKRTIKF